MYYICCGYGRNNDNKNVRNSVVDSTIASCHICVKLTSDTVTITVYSKADGIPELGRRDTSSSRICRARFRERRISLSSACRPPLAHQASHDFPWEKRS